MQILFVSSTSDGGSGLSQRQLARRLAARGHGVDVLAGNGRVGPVAKLYERQVDLSTRWRDRPVRPALLALQRPFGTRVRRIDFADFPVWQSPVPENAYRTLRRRNRPDVVVASSIERVAWRRLRAQLRAEGIPDVLYLREESALGHLTITQAPPQLLLANAQSHAERARELGYACEVVPSVIEIDRARTTTSRRTVLLVNAIPELGGDRVWAMAAARPDIPFVVQESGRHPEAERAELCALAARHPNVELRPFSPDPARVYRDARILLVPHRVDNRPRVILEAQTNGIPVLATDLPGLAESAGAGGVLVAPDATPAQWAAALGALWDDDATLAALAEQARAHAARDEVDPEWVVGRFEALVQELVATRATPGRS
jgi:glycosyltransferase involved in cell wall biosynthesis